MNWKLNDIYDSIHCDDFTSDFSKLDELIEVLSSISDKFIATTELSKDLLENFVENYSNYLILFSKLSCYTYLCYISDVKNYDALDMFDRIDIKDSNVGSWLNNLSCYLAKFSMSQIQTLCNCSTVLGDKFFFLKEARDKGSHFLSKNEESIIALMRQNGSSSWKRYYTELTSTLKILLPGKEGVEDSILSLTQLQDLSFHGNMEIRRSAYAKEVETYASIAPACLKALNSISGESINLCKLRGYSSVLHKVLSRSRMDFQTLNAMSMAIEESMDVFQKYFKKKAELLGHKGALPFYDIYAPMGGKSVDISYPHSRDIIVSCFTSLDKDLGAFAEKVFDEGWIDWEPRDDKGGYGLCIDIFGISQSRIQTNFSGSIKDTVILAHEIGHAYHAHLMRDESILNTEYPTSIAETCSIFCETIITKTLTEILLPEESLCLLEKSISDSAYYLVDFYGRFSFEKKLYEMRAETIPSLDEVNALMLDSMKHVYGDSVDGDTIHPYMWLSKIGYFIPDNEFLNFPYSFGVLLAKGLYTMYEESPESFIHKLHSFLSNSGKMDIHDCLQLLGVDSHSKDFWSQCMKQIQSEIEAFCSLK